MWWCHFGSKQRTEHCLVAKVDHFRWFGHAYVVNAGCILANLSSVTFFDPWAWKLGGSLPLLDIPYVIVLLCIYTFAMACIIAEFLLQRHGLHLSTEPNSSSHRPTLIAKSTVFWRVSALFHEKCTSTIGTRVHDCCSIRLVIAHCANHLRHSGLRCWRKLA